MIVLLRPAAGGERLHRTEALAAAVPVAAATVKLAVIAVEVMTAMAAATWLKKLRQVQVKTAV